MVKGGEERLTQNTPTGLKLAPPALAKTNDEGRVRSARSRSHESRSRACDSRSRASWSKSSCSREAGAETFPS